MTLFLALPATSLGANSVSLFWTTGAGYKPAKADCLALKSVFVIFFRKTALQRARYKK